nr:unnamed protein product [Digitaria exilis]
MARTNWEADKMLDVYIYDYLMKRNLQATAKAFIAEGKVATDPVAIDAPGGFLFEWWSIFWDIFHSSSTAKASSASSSAAPLVDINKSREHQMRLQLLHQHNAQLRTRGAPPPPPPPASINALSSDVSAVLASKMMEDRIRNPNPADSDASQHLLDANKIALLKSQPNHTGPPQMQQQQQQMQPRNQQQFDIKPDVAMPQRTLPADPSSLHASGMMHPKPPLLAAGLSQGGVGSVPLKGWPLTVPGIDQLRSNLGVQRQLVPSSNQFQLLSPQQQLIAQAQTPNDLTRMGSPAPFASPNVQSDDPDNLMKVIEDGPDAAALGPSAYGTATATSTGLSLSEVGNNRASNSKVVCCHFSSDGKLLASAGHEKKVKQGGTGRVRFQPGSGQLLAVAAGSMVNIFDVEKQADLLSPPKTLELWSFLDKQRNPIQAHEGLIAALAHSPFTGMIASASHDRYVKLWK